MIYNNNNFVNKSVGKNKKNVKFKSDNLNNVNTIVNNDYLFDFKNEIWYSQTELDLIKSVAIQEIKAFMLKYHGLTFSQAIMNMDEISINNDNSSKTSYLSPFNSNKIKRSKTVLFDLNKMDSKQNVFNINGYGDINSSWED